MRQSYLKDIWLFFKCSCCFVYLRRCLLHLTNCQCRTDSTVVRARLLTTLYYVVLLQPLTEYVVQYSTVVRANYTMYSTRTYVRTQKCTAQGVTLQKQQQINRNSIPTSQQQQMRHSINQSKIKGVLIANIITSFSSSYYQWGNSP